MKGKKKDIYSLIRIVAFTPEGKEYEKYVIEDGIWKEAIFSGTYQECLNYEKSHPIETNETP